MRAQLDQRRSGVLLHPSSLPSPYGIGDFGPAAHAFVDALARARQRYWQLLPLVLPDVVGSPYASSSAFAGNWLLISPELLVKEGLLDSAEGWSTPDEPVHYPLVGKRKAALLERACEKFFKKGSSSKRRHFAVFRVTEGRWLEDAALFFALKEHFGFEVPWTRWPTPIRKRHHVALVRWRKKLKARIQFYMFCQWVFARQWRSLKERANRQGVAIIGDLPLFVTRDSADTWADPKNFLLDSMGRPRLVAGVPPDYFSSRGQIWGDPLYDWKHLAQEKFDWWIRRLKRSFDLYDVVRLDHFRGLVATWGLRAGSRSARGGSWHPVPGEALLTQARRRFHGAFIAEDLGVITPEVTALRDRLGFPGVRVLQFGFDRLESIHALKNLSRRSVAYTGTHDNNTVRGWFEEDANPRERRHVRKILNGTDRTVARRFIEALFKSRANTVIVPLQDILNNNSSGRLNAPGTREGNWQWRFTLSALTPTMIQRLRQLTTSTRRAA